MSEQDAKTGPNGTDTTPADIIGDVNTALEAVQTATAKLKKYFSNLPQEDYRRSFKVGRSREPYIQEGYNHVNEHPEYLPGVITQASFNDHYTFWVQADKLLSAMAELNAETEKASYTTGTTLYNYTSIYEKNADEAGKRGDATGGEIGKELSKKRPKTGHPSSKDDEEMVDEGTETEPVLAISPELVTEAVTTE
jgi:hypothetical protein